MCVVERETERERENSGADEIMPHLRVIGFRGQELRKQAKEIIPRSIRGGHGRDSCNVFGFNNRDSPNDALVCVCDVEELSSLSRKRYVLLREQENGRRAVGGKIIIIARRGITGKSADRTEEERLE